MTPPRIGILHCGSFPALSTLRDPALQAYHVQPIYLPTADPVELDALDVILVGDRLPPVQRKRFESALRDALKDPVKTVIVLGQNDVEQWLPQISYTFRRPVFWKWRTGEDTGTRARLKDDPFWEYFTLSALNWHNHGLVHPPEGAKSLVVVEEEGEDVGTVLFVDEVNQPARLLVTTMDPVYHHGSGFMPGATELLYSLLRWASETRQMAV